MSEQDKLEEAGNELDSALSQSENCVLNKTESSEADEKEEYGKSDQLRSVNQNQQKKRSKSGGKGKLVRSLAVCEESSPRFESDTDNQESIQLQLSSFPSLREEDKSSKDDSEKEKEKDKNKEKDRNSEKTKIRILSKDCSQEYTDSTGIDLHEFLVNTLKNNPRDRMILLKMEQEIIDFISDESNHYKKFPQMSSYQRMLVHRVAAYFGMDHNVDQTGKSVIINKTSNMRIQFALKKIFLWITGSWMIGHAMKLSKEDSSSGSESSSSAGSSGSLSRTHQPVPGVTATSSNSISYTENGIGGQGLPSNTSYIILPLEAAGIPPGSILLNPHTGQPFVNPDGTPAIYHPPTGQQDVRSQIVGQSQQPPSSQQLAQQPQQQMTSLITQPISSLQTSSQSVPYPAISYPPQHLLTHQFSMRDDITTQFNQMSLSRQSSGDSSDSPSGPVFPSPLIQQTSPQTGYVIAAPSQQLPAGGFTGSGPPVSPQVHPAPPQGYVQPPPSAQMPVYYYPSGQYPTSATQQHRPMASVQCGAQPSPQTSQTTQQAGYQSVLTNQQQGFHGLIGMQQSPPNQNLINNQQGNQVQGMMVQYPAMSSYQVPMTQGSQGLPQQSYQQPIVLPNQSGQGTLTATGMPVYCNVIPPSPQNNLRLIAPHCLSNNVPVISASCRTNCANMNHTGWQVKY
ncbi:cAMP-regulated phosphoprotein 21 isoform X3 [Crotalus tigris]|uniref:cAMP-regulated phosphoprotein 21 isoform X3 n=1 Tax=Crotalus tigris TaxID=88082 RepID=UPI00192F809C|nr:cAMP-regulated phosphoprotein 21 isoform X3 [Crotalus tigris]